MRSFELARNALDAEDLVQESYMSRSSSSVAGPERIPHPVPERRRRLTAVSVASWPEHSLTKPSSVIATVEWASISLAIFGWTPRLSSSVAAECRAPWPG